ncbi:hypothetical protein BS78_06G156700 [Paspalum vaginatum]|nr:hypothetical protein BS78_06G156700 [Paspalum vaginatum]
MADMNFDEILEVPDTPDRIQQSTYLISNSVVRRDVTMAAANPSPRRKFRIKTRYNSMHFSSSHDNASGVLPAPSDTDHIFKQALVARNLALSEDRKAKFPPQKSDRNGTYVENEKRDEKYGLDQSSISNNISCSVTGGRIPSRQVKDGGVSEHDANHRNVNLLGVGSGLPTIPVGKSRNRTCTSTTNKLKGVTGADVCPGSSSGEVKGEVITNKAIAGPSSSPCVIPQRHVAQKKLVRNGCISPANIAKRSVEVDEKHEICSLSEHLHHPHTQLDASGRGNVIDLTENSPIMTRQRHAANDSLISGHNMDTSSTKKLRTDRTSNTSIPESEHHANSSNCAEVGLSGHDNRGKGINSDVLDSDRIGEANLRRVWLSTGGTSSAVNNHNSAINVEQGWRTTRNYTSKLPVSFMGGSNSSINGETVPAPDRMGNKAIMISRGRRKQTSTSHPGESSSALDEPRASFCPSSKITAHRSHASHQHNIPVITIDDISPGARPSSSGYNNGTSVGPTTQAQLESDELLARQLQEQLYNESPRFAHTEEFDAAVAMSLQHEEDATSRPVRRFQSNTRGARVSRLSSYRNAFRAEMARANNRIRRLQNTSSITLGLGAVLSSYPGALHNQPNIDLNDYDALLALDENNHQHTGASERQINNLPESVVQSNSIEEPCAVCLENPTVGDTIRHLPCFHKFHKECIDEWLKRKKLCPVCKSDIR